MSALKMRTPIDSARSRASRVTGTSKARMHANLRAPFSCGQDRAGHASGAHADNAVFEPAVNLRSCLHGL